MFIFSSIGSEGRSGTSRAKQARMLRPRLARRCHLPCVSEMLSSSKMTSIELDFHKLVFESNCVIDYRDKEDKVVRKLRQFGKFYRGSYAHESRWEGLR
jgi:hypothetical protein